MSRHKREKSLLWKAAAVVDVALMTCAFGYALSDHKPNTANERSNPSLSSAGNTNLTELNNEYFLPVRNLSN